MGVLTDLIVATPEEAAVVSEAEARDPRWPRATVSGLDPVSLCTLWALMRGDEYRDEDVDQISLAHEQSEEGPWVYQLPAGLVDMLATLDSERVAGICAEWARTDELRGADPSDLARVLLRMRQLAEEARRKQSSILMWICL